MSLTRRELYHICLNNNISFSKSKLKKNTEEIKNILIKKFCKDSEFMESKLVVKNVYYFVARVTERYEKVHRIKDRFEKEYSLWLCETVVFFECQTNIPSSSIKKSSNLKIRKLRQCKIMKNKIL